jgi:hypothetical protein
MLLPVRQVRIGVDGGLDVRPLLFGLQNARTHVESLGGDPKPSGDLLENLGRRVAQPALDLAEIGVAHACQLGQLAKGESGVLALLTQVATEVSHSVGDACHGTKCAS